MTTEHEKTSRITASSLVLTIHAQLFKSNFMGPVSIDFQLSFVSILTNFEQTALNSKSLLLNHSKLIKQHFLKFYSISNEAQTPKPTDRHSNRIFFGEEDCL